MMVQVERKPKLLTTMLMIAKVAMIEDPPKYHISSTRRILDF